MHTKKKTVLLGASPNPSRFAYVAAGMLKEAGIPFVPVGIRQGKVFGEAIQNLRQKPLITGVHTITLFLGPQNQKEWYEYILSLNPRRIIFNPGTENQELYALAKAQDIEVLPACNLVLLRTGQF
ncbi:CoA-binding protein [Cyclobacterium xiamenense]|uniref:CoA-binding protein n=1 Tax=Cyclobacterium xiamenense TaxID=1297121 RepID=UPI0035CFA65A